MNSRFHCIDSATATDTMRHQHPAGVGEAVVWAVRYQAVRGLKNEKGPRKRPPFDQRRRNSGRGSSAAAW